MTAPRNFAPRVLPVTGKRKALMLSCASAAIAAAVLAPQRAAAQTAPGYAGTINTSTSTGIGGNSSSAVYVTGPTATVNWSPTDTQGSGNIIFLPSTGTVNYYGPGSDYTVLNRIVPVDPSRAIELNGHVNSYIGGTGSATGGNIWFYSPGGILIGSQAVFDVGSLLLSTLDVSNMSTDANGFYADFAPGTQNTPGNITINDGATIKAYNALTTNNYVALVAPRIVQGGDVRVKGSVAYVATTALSMTMNQGLFDIAYGVDQFGQVIGGTDDANGIVHTGSTTGTVDGGRMYMMAVPKNQAMTMLIGGTIGYDATSATQLNGQIVLSAGITNRRDIPVQNAPSGITISDTNASIMIDKAHLTSKTNVETMELASINAFAGDVDVDGDLYMRSYYGDAEIIANGRNVTLDGAAQVYVSSINFPPFGPGDSEDRTASSITLSATNDGTITSRNLLLQADGVGQDNAGGGDTIGGDGQGGGIYINADIGGSIVVNGDLSASAQGFGGNMQAGSTAGGVGYGGYIDMGAIGGSIAVTGNLSLNASGTGGTINNTENPNATSGLGGIGTGGTVNLHTDSAGTISAGSSTSLYADGHGGNGQTGGDGFGGSVAAYADDGTIDLGDTFRLTARGFGGEASYGLGGNGGYGEGGRASLEARAPQFTEMLVPPKGTIIGGNGEVAAEGIGGTGGAGNATVAAGAGGDGRGGTECDCQYYGGAFVSADGGGGTLSLGDVMVTSVGVGGVGGGATAGGTGGAGGTGYGGTAFVGTSGGGYAIATDSMSFGDLNIFANGRGGDGGTSDSGLGGSGGDGWGGYAHLVVEGDMTAGDILGLAQSRGGVGGASLSGTGGDGGDAQNTGSTVTTILGSLTANSLQTLARSFGGDGGSGATAGLGGNANGGTSSIDVQLGGTVSITGVVTDSPNDPSGTFLANATAFGGDGSSGGDGQGGDASVTIAGTVTSSNIQSTAAGFGGVGSSALGGNGTGGDADMNVSGSLSADTGFMGNGGYGGDGVLGGGDGQGGTEQLSVSGTMTISDEFLMQSIATGGNASAPTGIGGSATGGTVNVSTSGAGSIGGAGTLTLLANATAGAGATAGDMLGGTVTLSNANGGSITPTTLVVDTGTFSGLDAFTVTNLYLTVDGNLAFGDYSLAGVVSLSADGDLSTGTLSGDEVLLSAGGDLIVGNVDAASSANFSAVNGLATFTGTVSAPTIAVTSADLDVQQGAELGIDGVTNSLTLNASSAGDLLIGGLNGAGSAWQLDADEATRIAGSDITVNALNGKDVVIDDIQIGGSQTAGGGVSAVTVNTDGTAVIVGAVEYLNAGASDSLTINAGNALEIITDTGSISMTDSAGNLSGTLALNADNVWIASQSIIDQLEVDPNYAGRDADLGANSGTSNPDGFVGAGAITSTISDSFLVQNSGDSTNVGGVTVGDGGLAVANSGNAPATLVINGRQVRSDGTVVSGDAFAGEVSTSGAGGFTSASTVNGCSLSGCAVVPPPVEPPPVTPPPVEPPPVTPPPVEPPPVTPPPVTPPPVTPPPVTPPPVQPPPVTPPPVDPPPVTPPPYIPGTGVESILGPVGLMESASALAGEPSDPLSDEDDSEDEADDGNDASVDASLGLIGTGGRGLDLPVDEPVTSGSDGIGIGADPGGDR